VVLPAHAPASREVDVMRAGRIPLKLIGHARALRRAASDRRGTLRLESSAADAPQVRPVMAKLVGVRAAETLADWQPWQR